MARKRVFHCSSLGLDMRTILIATCGLFAGCTSFQPLVDQVTAQTVSIEHAKWQGAELIMCRAISIGEWMRSVGPYPEKVQGWRALCVGASLPDVPGIP